MKFGWLNIFGIIIITIMLIPNIIYFLKNKNIEEKYNNKIVEIFEKIGRFSSMFFLLFPIGITGFTSVENMLIYLIGNTILLLIYLITWVFYIKKESLIKSLILAVIPTLIFLVSAITLRYLPLIISSIIFGFFHIFITYKNHN